MVWRIQGIVLAVNNSQMVTYFLIIDEVNGFLAIILTIIIVQFQTVTKNHSGVDQIVRGKISGYPRQRRGIVTQRRGSSQ
jgi:hypothetical protein